MGQTVGVQGRRRANGGDGGVSMGLRGFGVDAVEGVVVGEDVGVGTAAR